MRYSFTILVACATVATAHAQPGANPRVAAGAPSRAELDALKVELNALRELAARMPTVEQAVQALTEQLAVLEQELATLRREQRSIPDAVARLDALAERVRAIELEVRTLLGRVADMRQPTVIQAGGASTGGGELSLRTDDGKYALALSGYAQLRYQLDTAGLSEVESSTLLLRRARVGLSGHAGSERLRFNVLLSGIDAQPALDYYADFAIRSSAPGALVLRAGQYKTQFSRSFITSSSRLAFPERPQAIDAIRYDRDVQVGVHGAIAGGRVRYYAGVGNGSGRARINDNLDGAITARVEVAALGERFSGYGDLARSDEPAVVVGAGGVHDLVAMPGQIGDIAVRSDVDGDGDVDNVRVISASGDAAFRWRGVEIAAEVVYRREDFGVILDAPDNADLAAAVGADGTRGYVSAYGQVTYATARSVLVGARVGRASVPFLGVGGRGSAVPEADRLLELDGLIQYHGERGRLLGLMYSFQSRDASSGAALTEDVGHRVIAEAQLSF